MNEIERLKEENKNRKDDLLSDDGENKISKLLTNWKTEKYDVLHNITVLESKAMKLAITPIQTDKTKESVLSSYVIAKSNETEKQYFNNKILILYVNPYYSVFI